jgi:preprotein translocase subunit SecE
MTNKKQGKNRSRSASSKKSSVKSMNSAVAKKTSKVTSSVIGSKSSPANARSFLDGAKWGLVIFLGIISVFGNIYYNSYSFSERLVVLIVLGLIMLGLALSTRIGKVFTRFIMDAKYEMRKVSWPTRQEMTQLSIIVIIVIGIVSLILWAVDGLFAYIINSLIM